MQNQKVTYNFAPFIFLNMNKQIFCLRFCEDCVCRRIVSGPEGRKIVCAKHGLTLSVGSEANQCLKSGDFEEITASIEHWKGFHIRNYDDILLK